MEVFYAFYIVLFNTNATYYPLSTVHLQHHIIIKNKGQKSAHGRFRPLWIIMAAGQLQRKESCANHPKQRRRGCKWLLPHPRSCRPAMKASAQSRYIRKPNAPARPQAGNARLVFSRRRRRARARARGRPIVRFWDGHIWPASSRGQGSAYRREVQI